MKKSEFKKWLDGVMRYGFSDDPEETIIAKVEEIAGPVQWDPEGLPKRLTVIEVGPASLEHPPFPFLAPAGYAIESKEEQMAIYAAAVEAYNRIQEGGPEAVVIGKALYDELCRAAVKGYLWEAMERRGDGDK